MKRGIISALLAATMYGLSINFARIAQQNGITAGDLVFYRVSLLLLLCLPFIVFSKTSLKIERSAVLPLLFMGMISASVGLCYFTAVNYIPVSTAAMVFYTFPLVILILTPFIDKTPVSPIIWGLAAFAFLGLALVIGGDFNALDWRGVAAALLASITAATQFFMAKRITKRFTPLALVFYIHCIILPIIFTIATLQGGVKPPSVMFNAIIPVLIVALGYVFGFVLQMEASRNAPPALIGLIFCFEPVVALISASFILSERLTAIQIVGAICVLTALVTASYISLKQAKS